jgi:hypothetical protein
MSDNHQPLPQYAVRDLEAEQWHDDVGDQTTNCPLPVMLSRELRFIQKPDVFHQQGPGKYLRHKRILTHNSGGKEEKRKAARSLTSQHFADRLNNTYKEGVAFFNMYDPGHQTRHFILKCGYLFHIAARFAGLVQSNLCLALHQGQTTFKVRNP